MVQFKKKATTRNDHLIQKKKGFDKFYYGGFIGFHRPSVDAINREDFINCMEKAWLYTLPDDGSVEGLNNT